MPQVINTNVMSLNAQRNLSTSGGQLATALQRLSSGLRINSAKDDAAGLAIAERFSTQIRGLNQAARNANDGISLAQTGEGALAEITSNLQRVRELAVQAANSTNSASDRTALDQEVQQRLAEIQRVAAQTSFNGQKILDGTFGTAAFQVGANVGEVIAIGLSSSMKTSDIGKVATGTGTNAVDPAAITVGTPSAAGIGSSTIVTNSENYAGVSSAAIDQGSNKVTINGTDVANSASYMVSGDTARGSDSAYAKAAAVNASGINGVSATANTSWTVAQVGTGDFVSGSTLSAGDTLGYSLSINGVNVIDSATTGLMTSTSQKLTVDQAITFINQKTADTGVQASEATNGDLVLTAADGRNISVVEGWAFGDTGSAGSSTGTYTSVFGTAVVADTAGGTADSATLTQAAVTHRGQLTLTSSADIAISSGTAILGFAAGQITASGSLEGQDVLTAAAANRTMLSVDSALTTVSNLRSTLGAIQNRFESTITNLTTAGENLTASRSRIQDADFAAETAMLTRAQILQQAGTAILAQANAVPQNVLSLLR
jgi:flagellin